MIPEGAAARFKTRFTAWSPWLCAVASGLMLAAAFPPLEYNELAWIALVPLMMTLRGAERKISARLGFVSGLVFWCCSLFWLRHVTWAGWFTLAAYCALYTIPFSVFMSWWLSGRRSRIWNVAMMFSAAAVWTGLEYIRSNLFTGFAWNALGVSQHEMLAVIQISRFGGVYAVSALVMLVNAAVAATVMHYAYEVIPGRRTEDKPRSGARWHPELMIGFLVLALIHMDGARRITKYQPSSQTLRAALIQPNIPQVEKWSAEHISDIYSRLEKWTSAAQSIGNYDLTVWPETALPDEVRYSPASFAVIEGLVTNGFPLLAGSMDAIKRENGAVDYYNSSFLFNRKGRVVMGYDKQHLVIFGEYVPFRKALPFLKALTPISESFSAGRESSVFALEGGQKFSVLICFEDTVARLARKALKAGARLLINQTNDAWFDVSSGSRQHMAHCVFRCVENDVAAFRAANTGVTCAIDPLGRPRDVWRSEPLPRLTEGFRIYELPVRDDSAPLTFYTRHGDVFAQACLAFAGCVGLAVLADKFRKK